MLGELFDMVASGAAFEDDIAIVNFHLEIVNSSVRPLFDEFKKCGGLHRLTPQVPLGLAVIARDVSGIP